MTQVNRFVDGLIARFSRRDWAVITVLAALLILLVGSRPGTEINKVLIIPAGVDKMLHALAYGGLAVCVFRSVFPLSIHRRPLGGEVAWVFVILVPLSVGLLDEFFQGFAPGRSQDWHDLLADVTGATLVCLGAMRWRRGLALRARRAMGRRGRRRSGVSLRLRQAAQADSF